jgi:hypothetical protein
MTKEAPSSNKQPGWRVGHWVIWKFFSHYGLGLGHRYFAPGMNLPETLKNLLTFHDLAGS